LKAIRASSTLLGFSASSCRKTPEPRMLPTDNGPEVSLEEAPGTRASKDDQVLERRFLANVRVGDYTAKCIVDPQRLKGTFQ
jgi:hypothetical protein